MKKVLNAVFKYFKQTDLILIALIILINVIGFVLVYSATHTFASKRTILVQVAAIAIGFIIMIVLSKIDYHSYASLWKYLIGISILLLVLTLILGRTRPGTTTQEKCWIPIFGMTIQPSEIVKLLFVITFAKHLDLVKDEINKPLNILLLCIHAAVPIGLILLEHDFGMTCVFAFIFITMLFAANVKLRYFVGAAILVVSSGPLLWNYVLKSTQRDRILTIFDPQHHATLAYQQTQGTMAIGSGGIWGYGLLQGPKTQSLHGLPEKQNDFIFSVAGEELGFIGCVAIIIVLFAIMVRIIMTARISKDELGSYICVGIFSYFSFQTVANIGMNLFLAPVIGLTLPFISQGGTSIVSSFLGMGVVMSVYMGRKKMLFANNEEDDS